MNSRKNTPATLFRRVSKALMCGFAIMASIYSMKCQAGGIKDIFKNKDTKWTCERMSFAEPKYSNREFGKGYEFNCNFSIADAAYPRCYWDAKLSSPVNLSKAVSIVMDVRLSNVDSAKFFCFYLKSNGKWFLSKYYNALGKGSNLVVFQIADYRQSGTAKACKPELLNNVSEIRVNVFPKNGLKTKPTLLTINNVRASNKKIDGYASLPLFEAPAKDKNLKRKYRRNKAGKVRESRALFSHISNIFLKEGADVVLNKIKRAGFNVFIPEVWHGGGTAYRSKYTKIAPKYAKYFKGRADPTAEMIRKAHAKGIEVHPAFSVAYRGWPDAHPEFTKDGMPMEGGYLTPYDVQDPAFRNFIVKEIVEFAKKYDVDGIQLDYVRAIGGLGFSKIARKIYRKKYNADLSELKGKLSPKLKARMLEWQKQAVSDIVKRISKGIKDVKPKVIISVCGHILPKPLLSKQGRNERIWLGKGWVDIVYSMDYAWRPNCQAYEKAANSTIAPNQVILMLGNYDTESGKQFPRKAEQVTRQVDYALKKYNRGIAMFDYSTLSEKQIKALRAGPFKKDAVPYWPKRKK